MIEFRDLQDSCIFDNKNKIHLSLKINKYLRIHKYRRINESVKNHEDSSDKCPGIHESLDLYNSQNIGFARAIVLNSHDVGLTLAWTVSPAGC